MAALKSVASSTFLSEPYENVGNIKKERLKEERGVNKLIAEKKAQIKKDGDEVKKLNQKIRDIEVKLSAATDEIEASDLRMEIIYIYSQQTKYNMPYALNMRQVENLKMCSSLRCY